MLVSPEQASDNQSHSRTAYIMVGIPGSGKTTWARNRTGGTLIHIPLDEIRSEIYGYTPLQLDWVLEPVVWKTANSLSADHLCKGNDIIIDSMALTREFRRNLMKQIQEACGLVLNWVAVYLDTPLETAIERNRHRSKRVLESVIIDMSKHLQRPSRDEGYSEVIVVNA